MSTTDLENNRNSTMIQTLLKGEVNGIFLFFFENGQPNFILPPGLADVELEAFKHDFLNLFEDYARVAMKEGK